MKMQTVYKYGIPVGDDVIISMPTNARPLSVGMQGETMYVWALVNPTEDNTLFRFSVRGTGHQLRGDEGEFINTVFAGRFVWHVFWNYAVGLLE
jgi:hypothetical protein